jgi:hypothetical protein
VKPFVRLCGKKLTTWENKEFQQWELKGFFLNKSPLLFVTPAKCYKKVKVLKNYGNILHNNCFLSFLALHLPHE